MTSARYGVTSKIVQQLEKYVAKNNLNVTFKTEGEEDCDDTITIVRDGVESPISIQSGVYLGIMEIKDGGFTDYGYDYEPYEYEKIVDAAIKTIPELSADYSPSPKM